MAGPSITPQLAKQIDEAIEAIPVSHREAPVQNEIVVNLALLFNVSKTGPSLNCIHHKNATRNTRKTEEVDRKRVETHVRGTGCQYGVYISIQQRLNGFSDTQNTLNIIIRLLQTLSTYYLIVPAALALNKLFK